MVENLKEQEINKKEQKILKILFIPIMFLLGIIPLIVRLRQVEASQAVYELLKNDQILDFYSQYKATFIIITTAVMLITLFLLFNKQKVKDDKKTTMYMISILVFIVFTIFSTIFSPYKDVAMWGAPDRAEGMIIVICYVIMMLYTMYAFQNLECYKYIMISLGFLTVVTAILGFFQYIGRDVLISDIGNQIIIPKEFEELRGNLVTTFEMNRITGTMYNPNYIGSFTAIVIPLFLTSTLLVKGIKKRIAMIFITLCSIFLLFGSGSRAGILGTTAAIVLLSIIFFKKAWENKKILLPIIGVILIGVIGVGVATKGIMISRITILITDAVSLFGPTDNSFDYRDHIPVRDIITKDGKLTVVIQQDSLTLENTPEGFVFTDSKGSKVDYTLIKDIYSTENAKFSNLKFQVFFRTDDSSKIGGIGLVENEKGMFVFKVTDDEGIYLVDTFTQQRTEIDFPETIGFKGKEMLGSSRGYIWSRSLPMLKDTFFIGHGPDTYALMFPQRDYLGKYYAYGEPNKIVDKPHNLYLQIGINHGIIALIAFVILMLLYIIDCIKLYALKTYYKEQDIIGIAIMSAVAGYLVAGVFNDSVVSVAPIFWILLGSGIAVNYLVTHKITEA